MHEHSLAQALIDRMQDLARKHHATKVHRVALAVGELSGVEPALFQTAFDILRAHTVCNDTLLVLSVVKACWTCPQCGQELAAHAELQCPSCAKPVTLSKGCDAIVINGVDLEVQ